jgi:MFS family permease
VFALIGAVYIATTHFPASRAATLIGATQMFGMAGGSAGQFLVGPAIGAGLAWDKFWLIMGALGLPIALLLWRFIPAPEPKRDAAPGGGWAGARARRSQSCSETRSRSSAA